MIETLFTKIASAIAIPVLFIASLFAPTPQIVEAPIEPDKTGYDSLYEQHYSEEPSLGVALPQATAVFETSLAAPITASALSLTLTANIVRGGGAVSGYTCITVDEGSAQAEFICGTASGTSMTSLERGISPLDGVTEDTDLQFAHRRGANVKITDFPLIQRLKAQNNGNATFENVLTYSADVVPIGADDIADVGYVLSAISGTSSLSFDKIVVPGTGGETVATGSVVYLNPADAEWYLSDADIPSTYQDRTIGIAQGAGTNGNAITRGILLSGYDTTRTGMTIGANYFISSTAGSITTSTTSKFIGQARTSTGLYVNPGLLDTQTFRNNATNTITGTNTFSGATTFNGIGVTSLSKSIAVIATTSTTTWSVPAGITKVIVEVQGAGGDGGSCAAASDNASAGSGGSSGGYAMEVIDLTGVSTVDIYVGTANGGTSTGRTNFGSYVSVQGGSAGSESTTEPTGGTATGGDLNIVGQSGGPGFPDNSNASPANGEHFSGAGGNSKFGWGGQSVGNTSAGQSATGYGAGGSGGACDEGDSLEGGSGTQGIAIIRY